MPRATRPKDWHSTLPFIPLGKAAWDHRDDALAEDFCAFQDFVGGRFVKIDLMLRGVDSSLADVRLTSANNLYHEADCLRADLATLRRSLAEVEVVKQKASHAHEMIKAQAAELEKLADQIKARGRH